MSGQFFRTTCVVLGLCMLALVSGCGEPDITRAKAAGTVKFKGSPLAAADVTFVYDDGQMASGRTDNEGKFNMTAAGREGAPVGKAKVLVSKNTSPASITGAGGGQPKPEDMFKLVPKNQGEIKTMSDAKPELPEIYSDRKRTPLGCEVPKSGVSDLLFELNE